MSRCIFSMRKKRRLRSLCIIPLTSRGRIFISLICMTAAIYVTVASGLTLWDDEKPELFFRRREKKSLYSSIGSCLILEVMCSVDIAQFLSTFWILLGLKNLWTIYSRRVGIHKDLWTSVKMCINEAKRLGRDV